MFNILSHNRDDHSKNFSFLMSTEGKWYVSPAYDLIFSFGPNGEHCTTVMREGRHPTIIHLQKLAEVSGIKKLAAQTIIEEVKSEINKWHNFAQDAGVSTKSSQMIQTHIDRVMKVFL